MIKRPVNAIEGNEDFVIRRRPTTRRSGFESHPDATGGDIEEKRIPSYFLRAGESIKVSFMLDSLNITENDLVGFGGWFYVSDDSSLVITSSNVKKCRSVDLHSKEWHAFGSLELKNSVSCLDALNPSFIFTATNDVTIAFYLLNCGLVEHEYMQEALELKPHLLSNMHMFAPEANFVKDSGEVVIESENGLVNSVDIPLWLKSCNRCARFLPVNIPNERHQLSFTNHCVSKAPCKHTGFGILTNIETLDRIQLYYGFQLECRYCKKFAVNAALNHLRTPSQMKEDAARRRGFEVLLKELYDGRSQLMYRARNNGNELTEDIWNKFEGKCFKCKTKIPSMNKMHLDHTRPLANLWQLDETATCLCEGCNSQKRDRSPSDFYTLDELNDLSKITGIPLNELLHDEVNIEAVRMIIDRLDWLMEDFCVQQKLDQMRDNKNTAELFLKALQKVFDRTEYGAHFNLISLYRSRNKE